AVNIDRASFRESDVAFIELQGFLFEKLGGGTDEGAGIFSKIKKATGQARKESKAKEESRQSRTIAKAIGAGIDRFSVSRASVESPTTAGVQVTSDAVEIDADLLSRVSRRHQRLFAAICGLLESSLKRAVPRERRRGLYERLAALFSEF
ncbi:MAG: hypothetical protein L0177_16820, partial [Chloroflexi bacterium]|nr:hypothetical protein [Chloroflexota bacterium]